MRNVQLQSRDLDLLTGLFEARLFTLRHIAALYFSGSSRMAWKRVQALRSAGYVSQHSRQHVSLPLTYTLTKKTYELLRNGGHLEGFPNTTWPALQRRLQVSEQTKTHELSVLDVKAALLSNLKEVPHTVQQFTTWPLLIEFEAIRPIKEGGLLLQKLAPMRPDGYAHLSLPTEPQLRRENHLFFEIEHASKSLQVPISKCLGYQDYYASGGFAARCGADVAEKKDHPFRALFVLPNEERRNNLTARLLLDTSITRLVWITTLPEILAQPLGSIWIRPMDFRNATLNTRFDPFAQATSPTSVPTRNPARERFLAERLQKQPLFKNIAT